MAPLVKGNARESGWGRFGILAASEFWFLGDATPRLGFVAPPPGHVAEAVLLPAVPVYHAGEGLARPWPEGRSLGIGDGDQGRLRHLFEGNVEQPRGFLL